jgi:hypothetical protein
VPETDLGQLLLLLGSRMGRRRELGRLARPRPLADEALEVALRGDDEPARDLGNDAVRVGKTFPRQVRLAGSEAPRLAVLEQHELALEDVEALVLGVMNVVRRRIAAARQRLHHRDPVAAVLVGYGKVASVLRNQSMCGTPFI